MSIVRFENVSRIYRSGDHELRALDRVSFTLDEGKFVVILGPSGAGKSTALNMLEDADYYCVDNLPLPLVKPFDRFATDTWM